MGIFPCFHENVGEYYNKRSVLHYFIVIFQISITVLHILRPWAMSISLVSILRRKSQWGPALPRLKKGT
jgi:hypothetical protein